ncbi:MAG TPA: hypothetical protein VE616_24705 [Candidatus Udaeobacter sp.]|nr:hypothetical protein [Candidatus Udaeobacter sp.]
MGCTRNPLRIWGRFFVVVIFLLAALSPSAVWAAFASQFSLSVGEQYNDNIFFARKKEHDFVTIITPTLHLYYAPTGQAEPTLNLNISPSGEIYARHSELNSFGETASVNGDYTYHYSPRLRFNLSDTLRRQGQTRTQGVSDAFQPPLTPTTGAPGLPGPGQNLDDFVSRGDQLNNTLAFQGRFLYRPDITFNGGYTNRFVKFIDQGGTDLFHQFAIRGVYNWRQEHNLHVGYSVAFVDSRNGDNGVIHDFDFGDDYFTSQVYKIELTPTLSLSASSGLSVNTSDSGPRIANKSTVTITKLWETASLTGGLRKGLTPSFGISGISDTTSLFSNFRIQLAERVSGIAGADYSFYDTDDVNFKTFRASAGLQYLITTWLSSNLTYSYRFINSGAGATNTDLLSRGNVNGNSVFLSITARFDLWPNTGLARNLSSSALSPVIMTPFPAVPAPTAPAKP